MNALDSSPGSEKLMPLSPDDQIEEELVIGVYPYSERQTTAAAAIEVPSRDGTLRGTRLSVSRPAGNQITDSDLAQRIANGLSDLLGGWFAGDLIPYVQLYDSLVSEQLRERYRSGGITVQWDEPRQAFYYLAFATPRWQVQALGEPETFYAVFLGHLLTESEAIGEGGHPLVRPVGDIDSLLLKATPNVARYSFDDRTAEHARNVFDTYLVNAEAGVTVKAGIRMRLSEDGAALRGPQAYFYGIRINIDLRRK